MKGILTYIIAAIMIFSFGGSELKSSHCNLNKKSSQNLAGVYVGILPCADCSGIKAEIRIKRDFTYETAARYIGKSVAIFLGRGDFKWNKTGNKIILEKEEGINIVPNHFLVKKNILIGLNSEGKRFSDLLPPNTFIFRKVAFTDTITGKYWKLIELNGEKVVFYKHLKEIPYFMLKNDSSMTGNDGCNILNGTFITSSGNKIHFSRLISTKMACVDAKYEKEFKMALGQTDNFTLTGDTLSLYSSKRFLIARFETVYIK